MRFVFYKVKNTSFGMQKGRPIFNFLKYKRTCEHFAKQNVKPLD